MAFIPDNYFLFIGASLLLMLSPGPDMVYLLGRTVAQGKKAGVFAALGINLGAYVHLFASVLGLSAILVTSSLAFTIVKWLGAGYLIYLGIQIFMNAGNPVSAGLAFRRAPKHHLIFWQGFWSDVLNPKVALFYLAFLPQFVDPEGSEPVTQLLVLGITLNLIAILFNLMLVVFAASVRRSLRLQNWLMTLGNKVAGGFLVLIGIRLAFEESP